MNLVQMLLNLLGRGEVIDKIAALLDVRRDKAQSAVAAAVPTLLGALVSQASTTDGARRVATAVEGADDSITNNLAGAMESRGMTLNEEGGDLLASILPGDTLSSLTSVLSKFTGTTGTAAVSLLGTLAPVAFGFLKQQSRSTGTDPASITRLLMSQKENIAAAMPTGLSKLLGSIPGMGDIASLADRAAGAATDRAKAGAAKATGYAQRAAATTAPSLAFLYWLIPLGLLLVAGVWAWRNWSTPAERNVAERPVETHQTGERVVANRLPLDDAALAAARRATEASTTKINDIVGSLTKTVADVKDQASAEIAAPRIRELTNQVEAVGTTISTIPDSQRATITSLLAGSRKTIAPLLDKMLAIPGVGPILKPLVDDFLAKFDTLSNVGLPAERTPPTVPREVPMP